MINNIDNLFDYHPPKNDQQERYEKIRAEFKKLAHFICAHTPASPEQTLAIRKLKDAQMQTNEAIAVNE